MVLVDDITMARNSTRHRKVSTRNFIDKAYLAALPFSPECIAPWGWNAALRAQLLRMGLDESLLPSAEKIAVIRQLSHRRTASQLLKELVTEGTVGESTECTSSEEVEAYLSSHGRIVVKAPWSSSGRGIRFVDSPAALHTPSFEGWLCNTLTQQGSVMVEPYYNKVKDFGMEFHSDGKGNVSYEGLSLFQTTNGAYTGNIIATEKAKQELLANYIAPQLTERIQSEVCSHLGQLFNGKYRGPFGIDMMIVAGTGSRSTCTLHPCVEINLRRTMGHVALALLPLLNPGNDDELMKAMRIEYTNNNYKLRIKQL